MLDARRICVVRAIRDAHELAHFHGRAFGPASKQRFVEEDQRGQQADGEADERKRAELAKAKGAAPASYRFDHFCRRPGGENVPPEDTVPGRMAEALWARNAEARAGLKPLAAGERPGAVTVGAVVSAILAVIFTVSAVIAIVGGVEIDGQEPAPGPPRRDRRRAVADDLGLVKARYWAVLGFQMLLLLVILSSALGLVQVSTVPQVIATLPAAGRRGSALLLHDPGNGADPDAPAAQGSAEPADGPSPASATLRSRRHQGAGARPDAGARAWSSRGAQEVPPQHGIVLAVGKGVDWWEARRHPRSGHPGTTSSSPPRPEAGSRWTRSACWSCESPSSSGSWKRGRPSPIESKGDG